MIESARKFWEPLKIWNPWKSRLNFPDPSQHLGHALGVHAELLRSAAHFHSRALQLEIGIDPHRHAWARADGRGQFGQALHFAFRLEVDQDAGARCLRQLHVGLPGSRKTDLRRGHAGSQRDVELARGSDIEAVHQSGEMLHHGRHRIGLDRVVQLDRSRQVGAQQLDAVRNQLPVVGIKGRPAHALREHGERDAADLQAVIDHLEVGVRRMPNARIAHRTETATAADKYKIANCRIKNISQPPMHADRRR